MLSEEHITVSRKTMRVLITGATGMIGSNVLKMYMDIELCTEIIVLTRRPTGMDDPKVTEVIGEDFLNLRLDMDLLKSTWFNTVSALIQEPFLLLSFVKSMSTIPSVGRNIDEHNEGIRFACFLVKG